MKNRENNLSIYRKHISSVNSKNTMAGVTMVVLIVTIVVLLILTGITITSFIGDKGLLEETKGTKNNVESLQNETIDDLHAIANDLSTSAGDALNP